ncbi:MAG: epoxyqueuosine reductase QueH [Lachnospiraceae bacterium]|nr:epoxyqueuosine reductase QueH [Lachnospiraceae bacterium]
MNRNYQKELDNIIANIPEGDTPSLLLHACCAPCSSYCLEYLTRFFSITIFYYNPNISEESEYKKRINECKRLISLLPVKNKVSFIEGDYRPEVFREMSKGLEHEPERGKRCYKCYELRMREAAHVAVDKGFDYFTTTLSISPHKNADWINEIGEKLEIEYGIKHLTSDFKKKNGYKRSIELSNEYNLYRQNFCGCVFSKNVVNKGIL